MRIAYSVMRECVCCVREKRALYAILHLDRTQGDNVQADRLEFDVSRSTYTQHAIRHTSEAQP